MQIYPAIDIKDGRAVRLRQGLAADVTDYGTPAEAAMDWKTQGATYLHVVDLDGAFEGKGRNLPLVAEIVRETGLPVELGGGIRTMEDIEARVEASDVDPVDLALRMKDAGVLDVIYTDIRRDGMQTGPNVEATAELVRRTGLRVIGSGGVGKIQDLYDLRDAGCAGAIVGKALYNGNFTLAQALRLEAE